jgi:hypothetical protein
VALDNRDDVVTGVVGEGNVRVSVKDEVSRKI